MAFIARILMLCGLIPFVGFSIAMGYESLSAIALKGLISYAAIILSFMAGTHWAMVLRHDAFGYRLVLIATNLFALIGWIAMLMHSDMALLVLALSFVGQGVIERWQLRPMLPDWYIAWRAMMTAVVATALLWGLFSLNG